MPFAPFLALLLSAPAPAGSVPASGAAPGERLLLASAGESSRGSPDSALVPPPVVLAPSEPPAPPVPAELHRSLPLAQVAPAFERGARVLFGIGLHFGGGDDQIATQAVAPSSGLSSQAAGGIGLYLRLGTQIDDRWGAEIEGAAGSSIVDSYVRGALTADFGTSDYFTLGVGPLLRDDFVTVPCNCGESATVSLTSVGGTLRLEVHPAPARTASARSGFDMFASADVGATTGASGGCNGQEIFPGPGLAWAFYLGFGYLHY